MTTFQYFGLGLILCLMVGCASPAYRIKKNQAVFDQFAPDVQEQIRQGKVLVGFNPDMAMMALGRPDRKYSRTTADGVTEIWAYVQRRTRTELQPVRGSFRIRDADGRSRRVTDTTYVNVNTYIEFDRLRLEFSGGKLKAIEEVEQ